ncbi:two-component response regulator-like PRR37 isoform X2 [Phoenix dactylifera]|uniref:Two-component response regulator-like PRR37 isoform X2 n=1 Tax=Phoenix dactylifera TaxID=42345 RepID=A0A8B7C615_PHODC|nr:two-component response regulator-like PRR37 isoform X2 [Phoenix dactylifera]
MGSVDQVSPNGAGNKAMPELNYHIRDEHNEVIDGIMREGQGLSGGDESRINEAAEDLNNDQEGYGAVPVAHQSGPRKQQQSPGPIIRWERFLPVRSLKVLLVENDDSTRQVVSALLRNCNYEVTASANGLQAWKILEDLTNHIDLVLTEVLMPCLSGIGLLSKIMSHKTCKNIPVIMMSSNDSMGTVFKCLSKGAVDFLVKPIRKNELKNLWQHVWRRCQSSSGSGSGSESGTQTQKSARSKSADDSDNNSGSNDDDDDRSIGLNIREGSDNGSGTQSSWTKRAADVDSPQPMSPSDQLDDPPESTWAQVIHPKPETFCNDWVPMTANRECKGKKELYDDFMGKDLEIGVPRNPDTQYESYPTEQVSTKLTCTSMDKLPESDPKIEGTLGLDNNNMSDEPSIQAADLIGAITNSMDAQLVTRVMEAPNGFSSVTEGKDKTADGSMELPSLELSLKWLRSTGQKGAATHDGCNVLRRSNLSAFSRYHTSATSNQAPTGYGGSCSPLDNSSEAVKMESTNNMICNSYAAPLKRGSDCSSNNNDMGSTTNNVFTKPVAYKEKAASTSTFKCIHPSSAFHPVQFQASAQQVMQQKVDDLAAASVGQPREIQCRVQVHHRHHLYHHQHHIHSMQLQQRLQPPDHDEMSLKNMAAAAPQCGSSSMFTGPVEGNAANYSINRSNSGSNHGSNEQNGSSAAVNAVGMNMEIANGIADKSTAGGSGSGVDQCRFAWREAALQKFRQKRKQRNFGKKVRYQSRKRLAEQRPRMHGQFVRQSIQEQRDQEENR